MVSPTKPQPTLALYLPLTFALLHRSSAPICTFALPLSSYPSGPPALQSSNPMHSSLSNLRIAGLAVTTGSVVRDFIADGLAAGADRATLERTAKTIGLRERRVATPAITALDLCTDATTRLLSEMGLDATSIDAVIFVTQTPDHAQPNNASLLHGRLGLSKSAPAYGRRDGARPLRRRHHAPTRGDGLGCHVHRCRHLRHPDPGPCAAE